MSERGTLGYGTQTYDPLNPYLNDLHLTIDGWRAERDDDGWKVETARQKLGKVTEEELFLNSAACLATVNPTKHILSFLKALVKLMISETYPILLVQSSKLQYIKCSFGDASVRGFGITIEGEAISDIETGTWNTLGSQRSYNFREISNFVYKLENDASE